MQPVTLAYQSLGKRSAPSLVLLHGVFGSGRNWHALAQKLAENYRVFALDLRNHGASPHAKAMDYPAMAGDVGAFLQRQNLKAASIIGHSMGGKVAMWLALTEPDKVEQLIVVDVAPVSYEHEFDAIIEALKSVPVEQLHSRQEADEWLAQEIPSARLRQFLLTNLVLKNQTYAWRIDLELFERAMPQLVAFPSAEHLPPFAKRTLFLAGAESDYIRPEYFPTIQRLFPTAQIKTLEGAGHWLQVEQPDQFLSLCQRFLSGENP